MTCTGCHKLIGPCWEPYERLLKNNYLKEEALDALNLDRACCRRMMLSSVNIVRKMLHYRVDLLKRSDILHYVDKGDTKSGNPLPSPPPYTPPSTKSEPEPLMDISSIIEEASEISPPPYDT